MYIIRNFGVLTHEKQIDILKAFKSEKEEIFFPYWVPGFKGLSQDEIKTVIEEIK